MEYFGYDVTVVTQNTRRVKQPDKFEWVSGSSGEGTCQSKGRPSSGYTPPLKIIQLNKKAQVSRKDQVVRALQNL